MLKAFEYVTRGVEERERERERESSEVMDLGDGRVVRWFLIHKQVLYI